MKKRIGVLLIEGLLMGTIFAVGSSQIQNTDNTQQAHSKSHEKKWGKETRKKFFLYCILSTLLFSSVNVIGLKETSTQGELNDDVFPVMRANTEFLKRYSQDYNWEEVAFIDPALGFEIQATEDFSILDLLYYIPEDRDQGYCSNCWAWPSTSVLEIALRVQKGVMENRLSVQYMNTCGELYPSTGISCCEGGTLFQFAQFYSLTGIAIPWTNENAYWQDYVLFGRCEQVSCDEIVKDPNYPIASIQSKRIQTSKVPEETAIENIKNTLHQNKGVFFTVFFADEDNIKHFSDFWRKEDEKSVYKLDYYAGNPWVDDEAAGHALLVVGYHDDENSDANDYWIMLNSWGTTSGRPNGLARIDMHMNYSLKYVDSSQYAFGAETLNVTFGSESPTTFINGPTSIRINTDYVYDVSAVDYQGDDVYLYVNWGDGSNTDWLGPYESREVIQVSHAFSERQNYSIKAKAKDTNGNVGEEQPLTISASKSKNLLMPEITRFMLLLKKVTFFNFLNL